MVSCWSGSSNDLFISIFHFCNFLLFKLFISDFSFHYFVATLWNLLDKFLYRSIRLRQNKRFLILCLFYSFIFIFHIFIFIVNIFTNFFLLSFLVKDIENLCQLIIAFDLTFRSIQIQLFIRHQLLTSLTNIIQCIWIFASFFLFECHLTICRDFVGWFLRLSDKFIFQITFIIFDVSHKLNFRYLWKGMAIPCVYGKSTLQIIFNSFFLVFFPKFTKQICISLRNNLISFFFNPKWSCFSFTSVFFVLANLKDFHSFSDSKSKISLTKTQSFCTLFLIIWNKIDFFV